MDDSRLTFMSKILLFLAPVVKFFDKYLSERHYQKKITGLHYFKLRENLKAGTIFLTKTGGSGTNLINPSELNHSALYFGLGLLTYCKQLLTLGTLSEDQRKRLIEYLNNHEILDNVRYVIEAGGKGVVFTDLVSFLTSKDVLKIQEANFCSNQIKLNASREAVKYVGLPYDYSFSYNEDMKYCFELCANSYEDALPDKKLKRTGYKVFGFKIHEVFLSDTFCTGDWTNIYDSTKHKF